MCSYFLTYVGLQFSLHLLSKLKVVYPGVPFLWAPASDSWFSFSPGPLGSQAESIFYFHKKSIHTRELISFSGIYPRSEQNVEGRRGRSPPSWCCLSPMCCPHHLSPKCWPEGSCLWCLDPGNLHFLPKWVNINILLPHYLATRNTVFSTILHRAEDRSKISNRKK